MGFLKVCFNACKHGWITFVIDQLRAIGKRIDEASDDTERMAAFQSIEEELSLVQFANDECDFGMGLELGIDLFCHGSKYVIILIYEYSLSIHLQ